MQQTDCNTHNIVSFANSVQSVTEKWCDKAHLHTCDKAHLVFWWVSTIVYELLVSKNLSKMQRNKIIEVYFFWTHKDGQDQVSKLDESKSDQMV